MAAVNPTLIYRPLWSGVAIMSGSVRSHGTLGCFGLDDTGNVWLVTARHVLFAGTPVNGDVLAVYQPDDHLQPAPINAGSSWRVDSSRDVIAVPLLAGIDYVAAAIGIGAWSGISAPLEGALVTKAGTTTGVTQGHVTNVSASGFDVRGLNRLPNDYGTNFGGDSGAVWVDDKTRAIVGIHLGQRAAGVASVKRADVAFADLRLRITPGAPT
jgi:hypothetical protein